MASFFGVSRDTVRKDWKARGMPGSNDSGEYDLKEIAAWRFEDLKRSLKRSVASDDPMLDGFDYPNLERYRGYKADLAELELQRKRGEVVDRATVRSGLGRIASRIRDAIERITRKHGSEILEPLDQALKDAEQQAEDIFGGVEGDSGSDAQGDD